MKKAKKMFRKSVIRTGDVAGFFERAKNAAKRSDKGSECDHDWQRDGQTMMSTRWFCPKCKGTMLS
jgi:hypothetical protein